MSLPEVVRGNVWRDTSSILQSIFWSFLYGSTADNLDWNSSDLGHDVYTMMKYQTDTIYRGYSKRLKILDLIIKLLIILQSPDLIKSQPSSWTVMLMLTNEKSTVLNLRPKSFSPFEIQGPFRLAPSRISHHAAKDMNALIWLSYRIWSSKILSITWQSS